MWALWPQQLAIFDFFEISLWTLQIIPNLPTEFWPLPESNQRAFRQIIAEVDSGRITTAEELARRIQSEVYTWTKANWNPPKKYQAFNVTRIADPSWDVSERTFEIRSIRPQKSAAEYLMLTKMLEGRIEYLKTRKQPVPLNIPPMQNERQMYEAFSKYLGESGLSLQWFRDLFRISSPTARQVTARPAMLLCYKLLRY